MVKIITDSAADYEANELSEKDIICVPMTITFGEDEYQENRNLTKTQFYELLESAEEFPKTAQPTPFDYESIFEECKDAGDECVVITLSSALSGTYQNAVLSKNMAEYDECYVVDSLNATAGQRLLVDYAVKLRDEGKSAKEIAESLEAIKNNVVVTACIDTLEYLYKGGRLSKTAYTIGSMVNIKPLIIVSEEGKVEVTSKALSTKQALRSICSEISEREPNPDFPIYVVYSHNRKNADSLAKKLRDMDYEIKEENILNIGATIGTHVGHNACGYIYLAK